VLVTGSAGFTGRYLSQELVQAGHEVIGLASDLCDSQALQDEVNEVQPDSVAHLAAIAYVGHGDANAFYQVNLLGTRNLLQALTNTRTDVRSILLASSANIYGNRSEGVLSEDTSPDPVNDYAVSKLAMEYMANLWLGQLPIIVVRPFNYTGIGQSESFLIPKIVSHFRQRKDIIELGNTEVWREFNDVRTITKIYSKLLTRAPLGETLNICTGNVYSLREVIAICERLTNHNIEITVNQDFVRPNEVRVLKGDNSRLKSILRDFDFYKLEETLSWMLHE
jgi:nucleoside-diphosphate-sugar epimerase